MRTLRVILLSALVLGGALRAGAQTATSRASTLSAQELAALQAYERQLRDPDRDAQTKLEAATLLLGQPSAEATALLVQFLTDATNQPAQLAVARAVTAAGQGHEELVPALFAMLRDKEPTVRAAASGALGIYRSTAVLQGLADLARDTQADEPARTAAVQALSRFLDKAAVDALIGLLDDREPNVRTAAAEALTRLTGIRAFGADGTRWREWWLANKDKSRQQWLDDLLESLVRQNATVEEQRTRLASRLATAMNELYAATPAADRPARLLAYLRDPVADVRLVGLQLTSQRQASAEPVAPETARLLETLLVDQDPRVRAESARLTAALKGPAAMPVLVQCLQSETADIVREAIVAGIGTLGDPSTVDLLLAALAKEPNGAAVAAANAISRLADRTPLTPEQAQAVASVAIERYGRSQPSQARLREALLAAMAAAGRPESAEVVRSALRQEPATVRVAAIRGLQRLNDTDSVPLLAAMIGSGAQADADRGVRQAAVMALATLGGLDQLQAVLRCTDSQVEGDQGVRTAAWEATINLLTNASVEQVGSVAAGLADRSDAGLFHVRVLRLQLDKLADDPRAQIDVRVRLARALQAAGLPLEAPKELALACQAATPDSEQGRQVWLLWMDSLLQTNDPLVLNYMAEQRDAALFTTAAEAMMRRLATLETDGQTDAIAVLCDQALVRLADRLAAGQRDELRRLLGEARARQSQAAPAATSRPAGEVAAKDATLPAEPAAANP